MAPRWQQSIVSCFLLSKAAAAATTIQVQKQLPLHSNYYCCETMGNHLPNQLKIEIDIVVNCYLLTTACAVYSDYIIFRFKLTVPVACEGFYLSLPKLKKSEIYIHWISFSGLLILIMEYNSIIDIVSLRLHFL